MLKDLRNNSRSEQLMIEVLESTDEPLTLREIVKLIHAIDSNILTGTTPEKSLYSIIYRREKSREGLNMHNIFAIKKRGGTAYYSMKKS